MIEIAEYKEKYKKVCYNMRQGSEKNVRKY